MMRCALAWFVIGLLTLCPPACAQLQSHFDMELEKAARESVLARTPDERRDSFQRVTELLDGNERLAFQMARYFTSENGRYQNWWVVGDILDEHGVAALKIVPTVLVDGVPDTKGATFRRFSEELVASESPPTFLIQMTDHPHYRVQEYAFGWLNHFQSSQALIQPQLIKILSRPAVEITEDQMKLRGMELALLQERDFTQRRMALDLLAHFGPAAEPAIPAIMSNFDNDRLRYTSGCIDKALKAIGPAAVQPVMRFLNDPSPGMQIRAIRTLGYLGANAAAAIPALEERLQDQNRAIAHAAAFSHWRIAGNSEKSLPLALDALAYSKAAYQAARTINEMGAKASPGIERICLAIESPFSKDIVKQELVESLGKMECDGQSATKLLRALCSDGSPRLRMEAACALWRITGDAAYSVDVLSHILLLGTDESPPVFYRQVQHDALKRLGSMGADAKLAVPGILEFCEHSKVSSTSFISKNLAKIGPVAVPALQTASRSDNERVRKIAKQALSEIERAKAKSESDSSAGGSLSCPELLN